MSDIVSVTDPGRRRSPASAGSASALWARSRADVPRLSPDDAIGNTPCGSDDEVPPAGSDRHFKSLSRLREGESGRDGSDSQMDREVRPEGLCLLLKLCR